MSEDSVIEDPRPEVTIMVLPGIRDGESFKPRMLLEADGIWHETSAPATNFRLADIRNRFAEALEQAVGYKVDDALNLLRFGSIALANDILPKEVKDALKAARAAAKKEPPRLILHVSRSQEWIPWEAMYDGDGYLGLDFEIARLPILERQPRQGSLPAREVSSVRSVLGREVTAPGESEFDVWTGTFADVLPDDRVDRIPVDAAAGEWPTLTALESDAQILHVTCHGMRNQYGIFWTLNPSQSDLKLLYVLDGMNAGGLAPKLEAARPLVFGNACTPDDATVGELTPDIPGLANVLFEYGAANVVGSVASLSIELAVRFAKAFYRRLLVEEEAVACALRNTKLDFNADPATRDDPTYLLYCLYGPPDTRYTRGAAGSPAATEGAVAS